VTPGIHFTKTWQVTNSGTCEWTMEYALVHTGGDAMGASTAHPLPEVVAPGETIDLALPMIVPATDGMITSEWMLRNSAGQTFGVGPEADRPLTAEVTVPELPAGVRLVFAQIACLARWDSSRAEFLPCDDASDTQNGFVVLPPNGTIEVKPNNHGWIAGFFPPFTIQEGNRFVALVGCVDEDPNCDLSFSLQVNNAEGEQVLSEVVLASGAETPSFSVDLSELTGQTVTIILRSEENGGRSQSAIGYWRNASIVTAD
jgi:hypothetical protein